MSYLILIFLLINCFLHGTFASGIIPVLNFYVKESSAYPFSAYFLGIVLGQLLIVAYSSLSKKSLSYTFFEIFFGVALILMGLSTTLFHFVYSRFFEGIFAGLSLPLLFRLVTLNSAIADKSKKIALFNSVFAIGIVIGPSYVMYSNNFLNLSKVLIMNGAVFILINLILYLFTFRMNLFENHEDSATFQIPFKTFFANRAKNINSYLTLFYAKFFYGLLLSATSSYFFLYFPQSISIQKFLLLVSVAFVVGQLLVVNLLKIVSRSKIDLFSPILASLSLLLFIYSHQILWLFFGVICHSSLLLVGQLNIGEKPEKIRDFAIFNLMTDPGMLLGSFLASFKLSGLIAAFGISLLPLLFSKRRNF